MNTGRPDTNYGFWFPGPENDGAAGWQFMSTKAGSAWMGSSFPGGVTEPRGPWHYDGEIDLGFGGALRMAATVVTNDPTFGWFAYGASMTETANDAVRQPARRPPPPPRRRHSRHATAVSLRTSPIQARARTRRLRGRVSRSSMDKALGRIAFTIENRTSNAHTTGVRLSFPVNTQYELRQDGKVVPLVQTGDWDYPWRAELSVAGPTSKIELVRR